MRHGCQHHKQLAGARPFTRPGADTHYPPDMRIEPVHMHLDLHFDLRERTIVGRNTLTLKGNGGGGTELVLHAVGFHRVHIDAAETSWSYDGDRITITFAEPFADGEARDLTVEYETRSPVAGVHFSRPTELFPDAVWYAATDSETELARHWMPCVDLPNVRPTLEFSVRAESRFTILANGAHAGETAHDDGTKTVRWKLEQRCPSYITCIAVGDFLRVDDGEFEGRPVAYFASKEFDEAHVRRAFGGTKDMLAWMTAKLGVPFPYPKYFQFALPGFGGAMENISLVSWDDVFLMDESLASEWKWLVDQVNVHEMAHSYFGDLVVCRDFAHAWLKESWASYMEVCWYEDALGRDEGDYEFYTKAKAYFLEADTVYRRPIVTREFNSSWQMYDRHLYPGGACRLHTLRHILGDDVFWAGVTRYLETFAGETAETDDFRRTLEEASGRSLGAFFDQWIHSKGYPVLRVSFSYDSKLDQGTFIVEQTQVDEKEGVKLFDIELDLGWVIDTELQTQRVRIRDSKHHFVVPMPRDPDQVRIDPKAQVLHRHEFNPGDQKLAAQLVGATDVIGRIRAGAELINTGKRANIEKVAHRYHDEPFWGVRVEFARFLADSKSQLGVDMAADIVRNEQDARALEKIFMAVAHVRDGALKAALEARVANGLPHRALKAAYEALGAYAKSAPKHLLLDASRKQAFGGISQSGAFVGLAKTRSGKARKRLIDAVAPTATDNRARGAAVRALGIVGAKLEVGTAKREDVVETLIDLLRDPTDRVRLAAAGALAGMDAMEAAGDLRKFAKTLANQESVAVLQQVDGMCWRAEQKPAGSSDELGKLRHDLRKLQDTVELLQARVDASAVPQGRSEEPAETANETGEK